MRPAIPQMAAVTKALTGLITWLIEMRNCLAELLLRFYSGSIHRFLRRGRAIKMQKAYCRTGSTIPTLSTPLHAM